MSPEEYAEMSTERLLPLFVDYAKMFGIGRVMQILGGAVPEDTVHVRAGSEAQIKQAATECAAIGAALAARPTSPEIRALFKNDDVDVRMTASLYLGQIDPKLAEATGAGVRAGCSASEVIAIRKRVRTPPPSRPTLEEMSDDALLARYQDAGERLVACRFIDWTTKKRDTDTRNAILGELFAVGKELKRRGTLAKLAPFLDSAQPLIRLQAAKACLRVAPEKAVETLEALKTRFQGYVGADASWALTRLQAGQCAVDNW